MELTIEQLKTKTLFLEQENNRLRAALLDAQIKLGEISTAPIENEKEV